MTKSTLRLPLSFVEAVLAAQASDVEFAERKLIVHGAERLRGITRTGYTPTRILGASIPDAIKIAYTHEQCEGRSEWHVFNSMKRSELSPYISFDVASDDEARSAVLREIKDILRTHGMF